MPSTPNEPCPSKDIVSLSQATGDGTMMVILTGNLECNWQTKRRRIGKKLKKTTDIDAMFVFEAHGLVQKLYTIRRMLQTDLRSFPDPVLPDPNKVYLVGPRSTLSKESVSTHLFS
jgi:hypothetical protein